MAPSPPLALVIGGARPGIPWCVPPRIAGEGEVRAREELDP